MQEFEVQEKQPVYKEYFKVLEMHLLAMADAIKHFEYEPTPKQIQVIIDSLEEKAGMLKKWN